MKKLTPDNLRNEIPRNGPSEVTVLNLHEVHDRPHADRSAIEPEINWPDVQPSLRSRFIDLLLPLTGRKKWWASAAAVQARTQELAQRPAPHHPVRLGCDVKAEVRFAEGWTIYHLESARSGGRRHHVVFLHGGAYVHEIVGAHWEFLGYLVRETGAHCVVPIYPLAPRGTAEEVVPATGRILGDLIETAGAHNVTVVGNSAGGIEPCGGPMAA